MTRCWEWLDTLLHRVHLPVGWICDRLDLSLGITRDELRRKIPMSRELAIIPDTICPHITSYYGVTNVQCSCGGHVINNRTI